MKLPYSFSMWHVTICTEITGNRLLLRCFTGFLTSQRKVALQSKEIFYRETNRINRHSLRMCVIAVIHDTQQVFSVTSAHQTHTRRQPAHR